MQTAAVVIAAVGALGIGAQWIAWRTNWPAIVLMLAAGFLAGPILGLFDPEETFGSLLEPMIGIGVALILFEGGLSLSFRELQHSGSAVWRLATIGVAVGFHRVSNAVGRLARSAAFAAMMRARSLAAIFNAASSST